MDRIVLTTMCAIIKENYVLFINRKKDWNGYAFPGGHLEDGESIIDCVKREITEETGLILVDLRFKGITHFFNDRTKTRYIVFNFTCYEFKGRVINECDEGELQWININKINEIQLAEGMKIRFDIFFDDDVKELYIEWDEESGYKKIRKKVLNGLCR